LALSSPADIAAHFCRSLSASAVHETPYRHFQAEDLFPTDIVDALAALPLPAPPRLMNRGRREDASARIYFGPAEMARHPLMRTIAEALQGCEVVRQIGALSAAPLRGSFLRLEYAIDEDGFWLEPHTDIGAKTFTCLISLALDESQSHLGTDVYDADNTLCRRVPFRRNAALLFVPSPQSWHGFAPRPIQGRRKSIILNYVSAEWRARDQLSFPKEPVGLA
jgi:hypothetical protein